MHIRFSIIISLCIILTAAAADSSFAASCSITSNGTLAFGTIIPNDVASPVNATSSPDLIINCKGNATITVTHDTGLNGTYTMSDGAGHLLPYTFSVTPGPGTYNPPNNTDYPFTATGTVANYADIWTNNSVAGTAYSDTITFTVVF